MLIRASDSYTAKHAAGYLRRHEPGHTLPVYERDSIQCPHCDGHWLVEPGSGVKRGWCFNCHRPHCGQPSCWTCKPFEKTLEEALRKARLFKEMGLS